MKTLNTFSTEASIIQPLDWKSAFEMCLIFSLNKVQNDAFEEMREIRGGYWDWYNGVRREAGEEYVEENGPWREFDEDSDNDFEDEGEWWFDEGHEENIDGLEGYARDAGIKYETVPVKMWMDVNAGYEEIAWEEGWPTNFSNDFNQWFCWFIGVEEGSTPYTDSTFSGTDKVSIQGKGEEFLREATIKFNTDWKMIKQKDLADEVCSIMVQGPIKITPQSAISKLMLNPTKFGVNGIDKTEWGKFVEEPFTYDREWMRGLEKKFKIYMRL